MKTVTAGLFVLALVPSAAGTAAAAPHTRQELRSPNGSLVVGVEVGAELTWEVHRAGAPLLARSAISMTLGDGRVLGAAAKLKEVATRQIDRTLHPVVPVKSAHVEDRCAELTLGFGDYDVVFRAYDDAVAYRFQTRFEGEIVVADEHVTFAFPADHETLFPLEDGFISHNERTYLRRRLSSLETEHLGSTPALVSVQDGPKLLITESDLRDYAGLWLRGTGGPALRGELPGYVTQEHMANDRNSVVDERGDFVARTTGKRSFPWRILIVAARDADLLENQTVFKLGGDNEIEDTSWIRPGKVAWDWYNANNIYGVDFPSGVNTETYEYYIDFAADHGIDYVILDEGWYVLGDLLTTTPNMDVPELFRYARQKGVGIIPWVIWKTFDDQLEPALAQFSRWGAVGLKIDFMQRDDQWMVSFYERMARAGAKHHLLLDFHGAYKPAGLSNRFPNVITREGVKGAEHNKWSADITPDHDLTIPFIRMVAGPMDYTPGAMVNSEQGLFHPVFSRPMSQGTRCHQLAMYGVFESPLQMLADSPSHYARDPEVMELLSTVPTVWDETIGIDAAVGDYVLVARRRAATWYVAAMTDWTPRELKVTFDFLPAGDYRMDVWRDGVNAHRYASDYKKETRSVASGETVALRLAPGGGWIARLTPVD